MHFPSIASQNNMHILITWQHLFSPHQPTTNFLRSEPLLVTPMSSAESRTQQVLNICQVNKRRGGDGVYDSALRIWNWRTIGKKVNDSINRSVSIRKRMESIISVCIFFIWPQPTIWKTVHNMLPCHCWKNIQEQMP